MTLEEARKKYREVFGPVCEGTDIAVLQEFFYQAALNAAAGVCESVRDVPEEWGKLTDRRWSYSADRCRREILALSANKEGDEDA